MNNLTVFMEHHLATRPVFQQYESAEARSLIGNMPLLGPHSPTRTWLSNGSLPLAVKISPARLACELPPDFSVQTFSHIAEALNFVSRASKMQVRAEQTRLALLHKLLAHESWQRCFWKVSLFDTLAHLLGADFLHEPDLAIAPLIGDFLARLDLTLSFIYEKTNADVFLVSAFSHTPTKRRLNLNQALKDAGMLAIGTQASRQQSRRVDVATQAIRGGLAPLLVTSQGRLIASKTVAASPTAGCIFVNSKKFFCDGIVDEDQHADVMHGVIKTIEHYFERNGIKRFTLVENPQDLQQRQGGTPDLIVAADGCEFHDLEEDYLAAEDVPLISHSQEGFVVAPASGSQIIALKPDEVAGLVRFA